MYRHYERHNDGYCCKHSRCHHPRHYRADALTERVDMSLNRLLALALVLVRLVVARLLLLLLLVVVVVLLLLLVRTKGGVRLRARGVR